MFYRLRRKSRQLWDQTFNHIDRKSLLASLQSVGLQRGATVCIHSSLSRVGYFNGGPQMIIDTLLEAVGPDGSVLMPSFPVTGTMESWIATGKCYDVRNTPSTVGALTELFRKSPGVLRSLHPTHPLAGHGPSAAELLRDHEKSLTPYGHQTPYGRMAERDDTYILMISTQILSLLHHLQERVNFPNLFFDDARDAAYIDYEGNKHTLRTKVLRPKIPYYIAIPKPDGTPDWTLLHDYTLIFPKSRHRELKEAGYRYDGLPVIHSRRHQLADEGMLKVAPFGRSELALLRVRPFIRKFEPELADLLHRHRKYYDLDVVSACKLPFL